MSTSALHFQKINQTLLLHCLPSTVRPLGKGNQIRFQRRKYLKALCMSLTTPFLFPFACLCCRILYLQSIPLAKDVTWTPERIICKQYSGHFQKKKSTAAATYQLPQLLHPPEADAALPCHAFRCFCSTSLSWSKSSPSFPHPTV
jgi:hypothetical protein